MKQSMYFTDYLVNFKLQANNDGIKPALVVDGSVGMILDWPDFFEQQRIVNYCLLPSVIPEVLPRAKFIVVHCQNDIFLVLVFIYNASPKTFISRGSVGGTKNISCQSCGEKFNSCLGVFPLAKCLVES